MIAFRGQDKPGLWLVAPQTGTPTLASEGGINSFLGFEWSPDGTKILYSYGTGGGDNPFRILDMESGEGKNLDDVCPDAPEPCGYGVDPDWR